MQAGSNGNAYARRLLGVVFAGLVSLAAMTVGAPAFAAEKSTVLVYAGILSLDREQDKRVYQGSFADIHSGRLGLHTDVVHVAREEDAAYFAGGVSYALTPTVRPKLMIGSSTSNRAILPDAYAALSIELKPGEHSGWVITPGVTYRHYRIGVTETTGTLALAKYFDVPWDRGGYYVAQGAVATTFGGSRMNVALTGGLQTVRKSGFAAGFVVEGGALVRDPIAGTVNGGRYFAIRPNLSFPVAKGIDLIARGEYSETSLYTATGVTTGFKVGL